MRISPLFTAGSFHDAFTFDHFVPFENGSRCLKDRAAVIVNKSKKIPLTKYFPNIYSFLN